MNIKHYELLSRQRGLALPLTLILLLVMTLIGVATLRTTTMEENMTVNSRLRQVAFNAAESALTEAENLLGNLEGRRKRALVFGYDEEVGGDGFIRPPQGVPNDANRCEGGRNGGFCTPAKFDTMNVNLTQERWEDDALDVWNTPGRHIEYNNFANTNLSQNGVLEAPKYIIEFLGNFDFRGTNPDAAINPNIRPIYSSSFRGNCRDDKDNSLTPPNDIWPYCASDPAVYRITVRATAGPPARQSVVFLQSTVRVP